MDIYLPTYVSKFIREDNQEWEMTSEADSFNDMIEQTFDAFPEEQIKLVSVEILPEDKDD